MENSIRSFFDQMYMPSHCAGKIMGAMERSMSSQPRKEEYTMRQTENRSRFGWLGAMVCLLAVLVLGSWFLGRTQPEQIPDATDNTAPAPEEQNRPYERREDGRVILTVGQYIDITDRLSGAKPVIYCYEPEDGVIVYYALGLSGQEVGWYYWEYNSRTKTVSAHCEHCTDDAGTEYSWYTVALEKRPEQVMSVESGRAWMNTAVGGKLGSSADPFWLREEDGRLYFTGDGQKIDITGQISAEDPFLYTWEDAKDKATCIAVGGTYAPGTSLDGVGWTVFTKDLLLEENLAVGHGCWQGGYGANHCNNETGDYFPWYQKAKEHFGWPWA